MAGRGKGAEREGNVGEQMGRGGALLIGFKYIFNSFFSSVFGTIKMVS